MERAVEVGIAILIYIIIHLSIKFYGLSLDKELHNHVCWCVSDDSKVHRCCLSLVDYIIIAQDYDSISHKPTYDIPPIPKEYWVGRNDEYVNEILCLYQEELSKKYFNGMIQPSSSVAKLKRQEYFMLTLCYFLSNHENDRELCGKEMRTFKSRIDSKHGGYTDTYSLTDFGVAFFKLLYISTAVCVEKEQIIKICPYFNLEGAKTILDTKELKYFGSHKNY